MAEGIYEPTPLAEGCFVCKKKENVGILSDEEAATVKSKIQSMKQELEEIERSLAEVATIVHRDCLTRLMTRLSTPAELCSARYLRYDAAYSNVRCTRFECMLVFCSDDVGVLFGINQTCEVNNLAQTHR